MQTPQGERIRVVYQCKDDAERWRRLERAESYKGTPFVCLPDNPPPHKVQFISKDGHKIKTEAVEMVYNDMLAMDFVSNYGEDGPLYRDTVDGVQLEVLEYAIRAYAPKFDAAIEDDE